MKRDQTVPYPSFIKPPRYTHKSSLLITAEPHLLKNEATPIGDTTMRLLGKKYIARLKGESEAIPKPPSVKASRTP